MKLDGRLIASEILEELITHIAKLKKKGIVPHLYIILLTDNPSTLSYIRQKLLYGERIGVKITVDTIDPAISTEQLIAKIRRLNVDSSVHGIIVQRPVPEQLDLQTIDNLINPQKEIDGFGKNPFYDAPVASAVGELLRVIYADLSRREDSREWLIKKWVIVIGKGKTAGAPICQYLKKQGVKPHVVDSKTQDKDTVIKKGDIVISAVGKSRIIKTTELKNGVILIGVGMHKEDDGKFHGDFDEEEVSNNVSYYTPTPGGVGPVNVACLLRNLVTACERQYSLK